MNLWLVLAINSVTLGGLLFLLSAGFSLIFGLMRIPNLTHGSFFMLGAYFAVSLMRWGIDFWTAAILAGLGVAVFGGLIERLILRRLPGAELAQVLVTLSPSAAGSRASRPAVPGTISLRRSRTGRHPCRS